MKKIINNKAIIISITVVTLIFIGIIAYVFSINNKVKAWEDKIYQEVYVYGIDIGGLDKEEATQKLNENLHNRIVDKTIKVTVGDKSLELTYDALNPSYNIEEIVSTALAYGKEKGVFEKNALIKGKDRMDLSVDITYDEEALAAFENKVVEEVEVKAENASISINSGNISIIPEVSGKTINKEDLHNKLVENINGNSEDVVELTFELQEQEATIKSTDLEKINGQISSYSTNYTDSGDGRVKNMQIAAQTVSGTIVMPGEEFSYNALIGDTTPDKGYEKANTYVGNEIVPDYGGGICQVSTTLYRAVMRANIRSTERSNHSLTISYADPGLDATVSNGVVDYKFINTYDFPIYIQGYVSGGVVNFSIYGNTEAFGNKTYDLVNEILETYKPEVKYEKDSTMAEGTEKVVSYGMTGYKANSYLVTYENGVEVNREYIDTDIYLTTETIKKKGTKKKEASKEDKKENSSNSSTQGTKPTTEGTKPTTEETKPTEEN